MSCPIVENDEICYKTLTNPESCDIIIMSAGAVCAPLIFSGFYREINIEIRQQKWYYKENDVN